MQAVPDKKPIKKKKSSKRPPPSSYTSTIRDIYKAEQKKKN